MVRQPPRHRLGPIVDVPQQHDDEGGVQRAEAVGVGDRRSQPAPYTAPWLSPSTRRRALARRGRSLERGGVGRLEPARRHTAATITARALRGRMPNRFRITRRRTSGGGGGSRSARRARSRRARTRTGATPASCRSSWSPCGVRQSSRACAMGRRAPAAAAARGRIDARSRRTREMSTRRSARSATAAAALAATLVAFFQWQHARELQLVARRAAETGPNSAGRASRRTPRSTAWRSAR